jgi:2Fe-2S ferredoxin
MTKIIYVDHEGTEYAVDVKPGLSVMEGAVNEGVPGIDADCGGSCACATCHVYVREDWLEQVGPRSDMEDEMLDFAAEVRSNSRLSCQIQVTEDLDGLVVSMPENQH